MKFRNLLILIVSILIIILSGIKNIDIIFFDMEPSQSNVQNTLKRDIHILESISNTFSESDFDYIYWDCFDAEIIEYRKEDNDLFRIKIDESEFNVLKKAFINLADKGYISVTKNNNYILYKLWGNLGGSVCLIHSPYSKPQLYKTEYDKLFELTEIAPCGWYYLKIISEI